MALPFLEGLVWYIIEVFDKHLDGLRALRQRAILPFEKIERMASMGVKFSTTRRWIGLAA
jgi:hypothetical protein